MKKEIIGVIAGEEYVCPDAEDRFPTSVMCAGAAWAIFGTRPSKVNVVLSTENFEDAFIALRKSEWWLQFFTQPSKWLETMGHGLVHIHPAIVEVLDEMEIGYNNCFYWNVEI
jgi:hypothetical protein